MRENIPLENSRHISVKDSTPSFDRDRNIVAFFSEISVFFGDFGGRIPFENSEYLTDREGDPTAVIIVVRAAEFDSESLVFLLLPSF